MHLCATLVQVLAFGLDPRETDDLALARFIETSNWHLYYSPIIATFVSGPSDVGSSSESAIPANLDWYRALFTTPGPQRPKLDEKQPVYFDCDACHEEFFPCLYGNPCVDGKCECVDGSSGSRCSVIPSENGHCDPAFNRYEFALDRGDCCQASCRSTNEFICGYEGRVEIGFPFCIDPALSCPPNQPCWSTMVAEDKLPRPTGTASTNGTVVKVTPNGRVAVVGQPGKILSILEGGTCQNSYPSFHSRIPHFDFLSNTLDLNQLQVLDMHDVWKERTTTFGNIRGGRFGKAIAVSTMVASGPILDFVATPVDVRVAISEILITSNGVRTNVSIHDWHIDKFDVVAPPLSLVAPSSDGKMPFFDFFAQGRFIAAQAEADMIGIFDVLQDNLLVANLNCIPELGTLCTLHGVSEEGSMILSDSSDNVYHFSGFDAANATLDDWSTLLVGTITNLELIMLSRDGKILVAVSSSSSSATFVHFYMLVGTTAWIELGSPISAESFTSIATLSGDGLTAAFVFCDDSCFIHTYRYNSEAQAFVPLGNAIPVDLSPSISLSDEGSELMVSDASGLLQTYEYGPRCSLEDESYVRIFMVLEPEVTVRWALSYDDKDTTHPTSMTDSPEYPVGYPLKILEHECVPKDAKCILFRIMPSFPFADLGATTVGDSFVSVILDGEEVLQTSIPLEEATYLGGSFCEDRKYQ